MILLECDREGSSFTSTRGWLKGNLFPAVSQSFWMCKALFGVSCSGSSGGTLSVLGILCKLTSSVLCCL